MGQDIRQKAVLMLRDGRERTTHEIAEALDISPRSAGSHLSRIARMGLLVMYRRSDEKGGTIWRRAK